MKKQIVSRRGPRIFVPWITIEDNDPRWIYNGFQTQNEIWNASGSTLTKGNASCSAELTFKGSAVQYYAYVSPEGGGVTVELDGISYGAYSLNDQSIPEGRYYVKIFEKLDLAYGDHTIKIVCDENSSEKTIDLLSIIKDIHPKGAKVGKPPKK